MLDIAFFKDEEKKNVLYDSMKKRHFNENTLKETEEILLKRNETITQSEKLQSERNRLSKNIGALIKEKGANDAEVLQSKENVKNLTNEIKNIKDDLEALDSSLENHLLDIPNILNRDVPKGKDDSDNIILRTHGEIPKKEAIPHYEAAEKFNLIDFERGVKLSGSRFYVYNEEIARLERKLIAFMLDEHTKRGYKERTVPLIVRNEAMKGTGQFPKFRDEYYTIEKDELSLIPTAEVPLTNIYNDEILSAENLPIYLTAQTPCFRREAGSAGKDTRGIIRVHQFQKVELVKFTRPEDSEAEHQKLLEDAENILKKLNLTYRVVLLSSGDTSFSSSKTWDLEVYMPGLKRWVEISSVSNFLDFQARRAKIRYKNPDTQKNELVHTLNGSGVAAGRLIAALMEYYQKEDGSVDFEKIYSLIS